MSKKEKSTWKVFQHMVLMKGGTTKWTDEVKNKEVLLKEDGSAL